MKKKQPANSKKKAAPVAAKGKKPAQKKPTKQAVEPVASGFEAKEHEPETQHSSGESGDGSKSTASDDEANDALLREAIKYLGDKEQPEEPGIATVKDRIHKDLEWLFKLAAKKEVLAFSGLIASGVLATHFVKLIVIDDLEFAKSAAKRSTFWPVSISKSPSFPERIDLLRKKLELGKDDDLPFDIFKRFANKSHGPTRALLMQALLVIEVCRKLTFFRTRALKSAQCGKMVEECMAAGEVSEQEKPRVSKQFRFLRASFEQDMKSERFYVADLQIKFQKLAELLDVRVGKELSPARMMTCLVTDRNFTIIQLRLPIVGDNPFLVPLKFKALLLSIDQLLPMSAASKHDWYAAVEKLIFVACGDTPLASQALRVIGKSGENKSLLQAAGGDVNKVAALKKKLMHKKSPDTNILDTALRVLKMAFFKMLPDTVARGSVTES